MRILLLAAALAATASPAEAATRNFGITSFTKVRVEGPVRVTLTTGVAPFARASGDAAALDRVAIEVRSDTLVVRQTSSSWSGNAGAGPTEIQLGTHDLTAALLNGAGELTIDKVKGLAFALSVQGSGRAEIGAVAADQMNVNLAGTASAKLGGTARKLTAVVRGISTLDAAGLAAADAAIAADGAATIDAKVTGTATVDAAGPATIRLTGRPSCTVRAGGSTSVSGCR